ncbi:hypothetical protein Aasi_0549 [Candidatus Amoebophilus asiaticus 5a2]|uniref:Uncharacterized protein n=1 Tax=Amoebophilus asiaticus (strain 5a2) TaxID=452471 RepID=B3ERU8_AMOA5|nr:hypothetical protein [Candidatus Amoebophilus asiaticus]ACE05950.1 hypothetical protein Aasi_0549 [Candidatus Amoebophilus asiaticus 5a2]
MIDIKKSEKTADRYKWYIYEVIEQLKEAYEETNEYLKSSSFENDNEKMFISGIGMGYYHALEKFRNQAEIFSIHLKEIGLEEEIKIS